ncbi:transcription factor E2F3 [Scomber scombrus]|uniref:Transcription factor E2F3 n=1 Tax=Scomber scombrus TaxID=13677 RepID=A0AAV1NQG5_SCOSC
MWPEVTEDYNGSARAVVGIKARESKYTEGTNILFVYTDGKLAKRRLEPEAGEPQELEDGGQTANTKKPSLCNTEGQTSATSPVTHRTLYERSRYDTSLGFLTHRFADLLRRSANGVLNINIAAQELNAPKRRVYDVTNVLEGVQLIKKKSKNYIEWLGGSLVAGGNQELTALIEEEKKLDELIQSCTRQVHQMCEDHHCCRYPFFLEFHLHCLFSPLFSNS